MLVLNTSVLAAPGLTYEKAGVQLLAFDTACDSFQSCLKVFAEIPVSNTAWLLALGLVCLVGLKRKG